jgi:DNA-binding NtrC family response regulator
MSDKLKIIMVEDNLSDAELLRYELKKWGLSFISEVVETASALENSICNFKPDIILSDYSLPGFDGVSAFKIKQKLSPDIPFIIVSGTIGEENAVELIKSGVSDYVLKDKLFCLHQKITRALKEAKEKKEKKLANEKLRMQHQKLYEIAVMQSHQVRAPIANVLGLISLINFDKPNDPLNTQIIKNLKKTTQAFDSVIREIVQKTSEIKQLQY